MGLRMGVGFGVLEVEGFGGGKRGGEKGEGRREGKGEG